MIVLNMSTNPGGPPAGVAGPEALKVVANAVRPVDLPEPSPRQVGGAVDEINRTMQQSNQNLQFSVDRDTNKTIVRMVDAETGEVIRQIPPKEVLAIARAIDQYLSQQGLLLKQKA